MGSVFGAEADEKGFVRVLVQLLQPIPFPQLLINKTAKVAALDSRVVNITELVVERVVAFGSGVRSRPENAVNI